MKKYILTFVSGSCSVWVHLSTILRVQVWFRFTKVKFCWFRFGSGSPKWNGSFGFTVRVQVRFDTLVAYIELPRSFSTRSSSKSVSETRRRPFFGLHHLHKRKVAQFPVGDSLFLVFTTISVKNCPKLGCKDRGGLLEPCYRFGCGPRRRNDCRLLLYRLLEVGGPDTRPPKYLDLG